MPFRSMFFPPLPRCDGRKEGRETLSRKDTLHNNNKKNHYYWAAALSDGRWCIHIIHRPRRIGSKDGSGPFPTRTRRGLLAEGKRFGGRLHPLGKFGKHESLLATSTEGEAVPCAARSSRDGPGSDANGEIVFRSIPVPHTAQILLT